MTRDQLTSSTVSAIIYRITWIGLVWSSRNMRPIACFSTDGFHWGSRMCTRLAIDKPLSLLQRMSAFSSRKNKYFLTLQNQYPESLEAPA